jgi:hypothetical protein
MLSSSRFWLVVVVCRTFALATYDSKSREEAEKSVVKISSCKSALNLTVRWMVNKSLQVDGQVNVAKAFAKHDQIWMNT